jgi:hypothetical protein
MLAAPIPGGTMIGRKIPAKQILAIGCPVCGAAPKQPCELSTGAQRSALHRERILVAEDKPRRRSSMGTSPKTNATRRVQPSDSDNEELGLWVDTRLLTRHLKQPSQSIPNQPISSDRLLHFADLALGSIKPDKFKAEKVSKKRKK